MPYLSHQQAFQASGTTQTPKSTNKKMNVMNPLFYLGHLKVLCIENLTYSHNL